MSDAELGGGTSREDLAAAWMGSRGLSAGEPGGLVEAALAAYACDGGNPEDVLTPDNSKRVGPASMAYATESLDGGRSLVVASIRVPGSPGVATAFAAFARRAGAFGLPLLGTPGPLDSLLWVVLSAGETPDEDAVGIEAIRDAGCDELGLASFGVTGITVADLARAERGRSPFAEATLRFRGEPEADPSGRTVVGMVSVADIHGFMCEYERSAGSIDRLYSENVRLEQGSSRINRVMRETLQSSPRDFGKYNNGITVIADSATPGPDGGLVLRGASVINGCQTTRSVLAVFRDPKRPAIGPDGNTAAGLERWARLVRDEAFVVVKLVVVGDGPDADELVYSVTKYANSQNAIGTTEMLGQNEFLAGVQAAFAAMQDHPVYVETKQGGWVAEKQRQASTPDRYRTAYGGTVTAKDLIKAAVAVHLGKPGAASQGVSRFVPGEGKGGGSAAMTELRVSDYYAAYAVSRSLSDAGLCFSGRSAGEFSQARWLSCFLLADALCRTADASGVAPGGGRSAILSGVLDGPLAEVAVAEVAGEMSGLYGSYLSAGQSGTGFPADSGSDDRAGFLRSIDGDSLPPGMAALWDAAVGRLSVPGTATRSAVGAVGQHE